MSKIINVRLELDKIDKSKIIVGEKGKYLNIIVAERKETDQYGNTHTVYIQQTKEEREAKEEKKYMGSGKEYEFENDVKNLVPGSEDDDLPF
ncbi:hypothetical protein BN1195_03642 [Chryseobacterium oranimense G311]|uniref:hypothetical protein n=1 Tax=Chryseobacterium oranimense TaxID=421058 RepID=UPI0005339DBB|nr:hypothetical protein [Chryseobacterium oranimense]CEJ71297.1 hypothetical protein BN1195_03642 [Chryseobacterium oranimense G311]DAG72840.1 MAG TPA: hypothetical protein [Caudoviricetes sp.]